MSQHLRFLVKFRSSTGKIPTWENVVKPQVRPYTTWVGFVYGGTSNTSKTPVTATGDTGRTETPSKCGGESRDPEGLVP